MRKSLKAVPFTAYKYNVNRLTKRPLSSMAVQHLFPEIQRVVSFPTFLFSERDLITPGLLAWRLNIRRSTTFNARLLLTQNLQQVL